MQPMPVGIDIAKHIIQVHYVDDQTGEVVNKPLKRDRFLAYFANRPSCLIGMEACGGAHHWARQLLGMGHQVKLMPGAYVKAFNLPHKNDMADAQAIWRAVQQPSRAVAVKSETQQAMLALHRIRSQLLKCKQMQGNALRGLIAEYGEIIGKGQAALNRRLPEILILLSERLPGALIDSLREQWHELDRLEERVVTIERRIRELSRADEAVKALVAIPGVGLLTATATAAVAAMGDPRAFSSGREFAAWAGLVPRQTGTGGKITLQGISKQGDRYLRKLFINGAHSVIQNAKDPGPWVRELQKRRPLNVAVVALANKMARTIWAVLAHDRPYQCPWTAVSAP
ncbi:IS110 family transposase [Pseudomonas caricapapayae]|nr:IS110 family transposase [Pseudomonas caricapapayae]KAA8690101.1 IS110 family transposase [Pseudomonas caricapapayae]RMV96386.1 hypothetical protein ALP01_200120 [Pseudomonas caricapapayae]